jgi:hypothetical protein
MRTEPSTLLEIAQRLKLDESACRRTLMLAGLTPTLADWQRYVDRFLPALGALPMLAGIAAFFAWNWPELERLATQA